MRPPRSFHDGGIVAFSWREFVNMREKLEGKQAVLRHDFLIFAYFVTREEVICVFLIPFRQLKRYRKNNKRVNNKYIITIFFGCLSTV